MQLKGLYGGPILMNVDELDTPNKILVPVHNNSDRDITVSDQEDLVNIEVMTVQH
jgi:hypothetical protein